ncbi:MAG: hypothetical protein AB7U46_06690 [Paenirhodobacter sp.]|uniref:hypothetical protein n=1 Tax=Paenirhodobacter sp. TaxID=1965326 RepID=UPI003D145827
MLRLKAILTFTAALAFAAASYSARNFRGYDPAAFPVPVVNPPFQPAPWAFSIWGVIFLALIVQAGFGLFRRAEDRAWDAPRWALFLSMALGANWLAVAMQAPVLATVQIWVMAALSLAALALVPKGAEFTSRAAPIGLYAGWLTAATMVATGTVLVGYGLLPLGVATWVVLAAAVIVGLAVTARLAPGVAYPAGVIWALIGIIAANTANTALVAAAGGAILALGVTAWIRRAG